MLTALQSLFISWQFVKFLAVGGVGALAHWLARFAFEAFMGFGAAVVLAFMVGLTVAFVLNRFFVFPRSARPVRDEMIIFTIVNAASFPVVVGISFFLGTFVLPKFLSLEIAKALGHGVGVLSPVFVNFVAHKLITFKSLDEAN